MVFEDIVMLILASLLLFFGHICRAARWSLLIPSHFLPRRFNLLFGLSLGYALNVLVPWRLGELLRVYYVSAREKIPFMHTAATVFVERLTDMIVIAVVLLVATFYGSNQVHNMYKLAITLFVISALLFYLISLISKSARLRKLIWTLASVFNDEIRDAIFDFFWTSGEILDKKRILNRDYLFTSLIMWTCYLCSYYFYAKFNGDQFNTSLYYQFGNLQESMIGSIFKQDANYQVFFLMYSVLPVLAVILYGFTHQSASVIRNLVSTIKYPNNRSLGFTREKFEKYYEYKSFLGNHFSGKNQLVSDFSLIATDNGVVQRLFNGGSDAVTALIQVDHKLAIRKFASANAALKLEWQSAWLKQYSNSILPLVQISYEKKVSDAFFYDMPYVLPANDFYDVIHTAPFEVSESILNKVSEKMKLFHGQNHRGLASQAEVSAYLDEKVIANVKLIREFAESILDSTEYKINDKNFNVKSWDVLSDERWLHDQISNLDVSVIHGDLTIENIIVSPTYADGFYIIDPNPENIFNSPLIDYAKLMQSLHLGYEDLNKNKSFGYSNNAINVRFTRSMAYSNLHNKLENFIVTEFGKASLKEVYFHELVNYLRLTTYKIRRGSLEGLAFFACCSILLEEYLSLTEV